PVRRLSKGEIGTGYFTRGQQQLLVSWSPVGLYGWGVLVEMPTAAISASVWSFEQHLVILGLMFVALALVFGYLLASLYNTAEIGNRFLELSNDNFCIAGP